MAKVELVRMDIIWEALMPKLTKIIATIGIRKASYDSLKDDAARKEFDRRAAEYLGKLIDAGMDVARFNLSFAPASFYLPYMRMAKEEAGKRGRRLGILCDLQGPKVRLGKIPAGIGEVKMGQELRFRAEGIDREEDGIIPIIYHDPRFDLLAQVPANAKLYIDEGHIICNITKIEKPYLTAVVVKEGHLEPGKGIFVQAEDGSMITFDMSPITRKDEEDLRALKDASDAVDHIALSFVRRASDIQSLRKNYLDGPLSGKSIVAKIETAEAVTDRDRLSGIICASDGVMVARGDLGIEKPLPELLRYQKDIIPLCIRERVFVVVATQMLESMTSNEFPTRAEVSDVANAVYDGADAVMLSAETAVGKYPAESVRMMADICLAAERHQATREYAEFHPGYLIEPLEWGKDKIAASAAVAAVDLARGVGAKAFLINSRSGNTAMLVARLRPQIPIAALTNNEEVIGKLTLVRGVHPFPGILGQGVEESLDAGLKRICAFGLCKSGDTIIYLSGSHIGIGGASNQLRIVEVV
jgi:pyruvate kinase